MAKGCSKLLQPQTGNLPLVWLPLSVILGELPNLKKLDIWLSHHYFNSGRINSLIDSRKDLVIKASHTCSRNEHSFETYGGKMWSCYHCRLGCFACLNEA